MFRVMESSCVCRMLRPAGNGGWFAPGADAVTHRLRRIPPPGRFTDGGQSPAGLRHTSVSRAFGCTRSEKVGIREILRSGAARRTWFVAV